MESVFEKYIDDIRGILPFHRIILFVIVATMSVISHDAILRPLVVEFLALPANLDGTVDFINGAIVGDFVAAGAFVICAWLVHRFTSKWMISRIWLKLKIQERLKQEYDAFDQLALGEELRVAALEFASQEATRRAAVSKARAMIAELCIGAGLCFAVYSVYGRWVDALIGIALIVVGLIFQAYSFLYYLRHVMPFELNASALAGFGRRLGMPESM